MVRGCVFCTCGWCVDGAWMGVWTCGCVCVDVWMRVCGRVDACVDVWTRVWTCGQVGAYVWNVRGRVLERRGRCVDNAKPRYTACYAISS